jgi:hypothetical protein
MYCRYYAVTRVSSSDNFKRDKGIFPSSQFFKALLCTVPVLYSNSISYMPGLNLHGVKKILFRSNIFLYLKVLSLL